MPDENGTEATRSDAPSADESLFGEVADDTEAVVADGQDANEKSDREKACLSAGLLGADRREQIDRQ